MSEDQAEEVLFEKLGLEKSILEIKSERRRTPGEDDNVTANNYVDKIYKSIQEECFESYSEFHWKSWYVRIILLHPDTEKSFMEVVYRYSTREDAFNKKSYVGKLTGISEDDMRFTEMVTGEECPPKVNLSNLIHLKSSGLARAIMVYLCEKGAVFGYVLQLERLSLEEKRTKKK